MICGDRRRLLRVAILPRRVGDQNRAVVAAPVRRLERRDDAFLRRKNCLSRSLKFGSAGGPPARAAHALAVHRLRLQVDELLIGDIAGRAA